MIVNSCDTITVIAYLQCLIALKYRGGDYVNLGTEACGGWKMNEDIACVEVSCDCVNLGQKLVVGGR